MKKEKNEKGIALVLIIAVIIACMIIGGVILYYIISNLKQAKSNNTANTMQSGQSVITTQNTPNTNNSNTTIKQIKEKKYTEIFGINGTGIYPPQSYTINNIVSINPNNNERLYVKSIAGHISSSDTELIYLIDDKKEVEIKFEYKAPNDLVLQETVENMDIYILDSLAGKINDLGYTRYILLDEVPFESSDSNFQGYKYYMVLKPSAGVENKEICEIAKNIVIDKTKGEFTNETAIRPSNEYLTKKIGKYTLNFENVILTNWGALASGQNEITYFVKKDNGYLKIRMTLPIREKANNTYGLSNLKASIEKNNNKQDKVEEHELVEMDINGMIFNAVRIKNISSGEEIISRVFLEIDKDNLLCIEIPLELKDIEKIKEYIDQNVANKVIFQ